MGLNYCIKQNCLKGLRQNLIFPIQKPKIKAIDSPDRSPSGAKSKDKVAWDC